MNPTPVTPVYQDMEFLKEDGHVGDCVRAATATLLGISRADVPHFVKEHSGGWRGPWEDWLEDRGFAVLELDPRLRPACRFLACGPTIRDGGDHPAAHMVVMEHRDLYHDPHPSRAGIVTVDRVYVVAPAALDQSPIPPSPNTSPACELCQGTGEIVTDWDRYRHPHPGDAGDEAVADCPDCDGTGTDQ